ncbi:hypothetical protein LNKW23_35630 [Paralimibaculum aggregatum]|uniref:Polyketide cyclase n=1 Tax=Paralimibaculum aggregatum TaxID=3036245 RepID=A0ABQ6LMC7_9RHOB|nr:SRPBCC family protein [Limibaculum sp. NKW23]GMG84348.1 hypothetical protein LNKW23_35630 [Limibaculum sp. NKW23]
MLRKILIGIVVLVLALVGGSYLLPRHVEVARSVVIDRPAAEIYPHLADLEAFHQWSPWSMRDAAMAVEITGGPGEGQRMSWSSEEMGAGSQTITEAVPYRHVVTALDFGDMGTATASFALTQENGSSTRVTWRFETDTGMDPVARWMGLMMDDWVGADYEAGLANLKARVEGS